LQRHSCERRPRRKVIFASEVVTLLAAASLIAISAGCVHGPSTRPVLPAASPPSMTKPRTYEAGQRIALEGGSSVVVPSGWKARLYAPGARIATPQATSGSLGLVMEVPTVPHWGTAMIGVFGPKADFDQQRIDMEAAYREGLSGSNPAGTTLERVDTRLSDDSTATAYILAVRTQPSRREVSVFITPHASEPLLINFEMSSLPSGSVPTTDSGLPHMLLGYIGFRVR
jgi:hypothetical protein